MPNVRDLLAIKGHAVAAITPYATVYEAAVRMNERKIGSLVVEHDGQPVGIITERDILQRLVAQRLDAGATRVEDVMTTELVCCQPQTSLDEARTVLKNRRIRHLPVCDDDGKLIGLISIGDLNAYQANTQEQTIYLLQEYISGHA